ncbi:LOW QUALITY PROTEIN: hypothetical protein BFAG_04905, partial [Bacteroides fragilis 3_1_12]
CPFAVRVPLRLSLADFLGSMFTRTITVFRGNWYTVRFDSYPGFAWDNQHLHPLTDYSVSPRRCHSSVSTSLLMLVQEY